MSRRGGRCNADVTVMVVLDASPSGRQPRMPPEALLVVSRETPVRDSSGSISSSIARAAPAHVHIGLWGKVGVPGKWPSWLVSVCSPPSRPKTFFACPMTFQPRSKVWRLPWAKSNSKSRVKRERSFSLYGHRKPGYGRSERSYGLSWTDIDRTR